MKKYRVIKFFTDLQDKGYAYNVGDVFPRHGLNVTESRIKQLMSAGNKQHTPLIEVEEDTEEGFSEVKEDAEDTQAIVDAPKKSEGKKKPRKTQGK